jgi:hypothetical protein
VEHEHDGKMAVKKGSRSPVILLIVVVIFALFTWGFFYSFLRRNGYDEPTSQLAGIAVGVFAVALLEGYSRLKIRRVKNQM